MPEPKNPKVQEIIKRALEESPAAIFSRRFYRALKIVGGEQGEEMVQMFNKTRDSEKGIKASELKYPELLKDETRLETELRFAYNKVLELMAKDIFKKAILTRLEELIRKQNRNITSKQELEEFYRRALKESGLGNDLINKILELRGQMPDKIDPAVAYKDAYETVAVLEFTRRVYAEMAKMRD